MKMSGVNPMNTINLSSNNKPLDLNDIHVFIKVVELKSFTKAAKILNMPISTVSHKVSKLEEQMGLTFLRRSTRKLSLTEEGQQLYNLSQLGLSKIFEAVQNVQNNQNQIQGVLKITAPVDFGQSVLPSIIKKFNKLHPKVQIQMHLTDQIVDLIGEGFDLAIRIGEPKDSNLKFKKFGEINFGLFCHMNYYKKNLISKIKLNDLSELKNHPFLHFSINKENNWNLTNQNTGRTYSMNVNPIYISNDLNTIKTLTLKEMGICLMPLFYCVNEVQKNQLVQLFKDYKTNSRPVYFLYPQMKSYSAKVKSFINVASQLYQDSYS